MNMKCTQRTCADKMKQTLLLFLLTISYLELGESAPLIEDSLESRLATPSVSGHTFDFYHTSTPDDQPSRSDDDSESVSSDGISPSLDEDDLHCKVQLRVEVEQCLKCFDLQKEVFGNPDLTSQQRKKLTPDFCR